MALIDTKKRIKDEEKHPTRYFSSRQEKSVEKDLGGERTKNSGATTFDKGDVKTDKFLIECKTKTTPSQSMSIKKEWIEKNNKEALFMGKPYTAIAFNFGPDQDNYYIIDKFLFQELIKYIGKEDE